MSWVQLALAVFVVVLVSESGMALWARARPPGGARPAFEFGRWSLLGLGLNLAATLLLDRQVPLTITADTPALLWLGFGEGGVLLVGLAGCGLSWACTFETVSAQLTTAPGPEAEPQTRRPRT